MVGRLDGTLDRTPMSVEADGRTVTIRLPKMIGAARALLRLRKLAPSRSGFRLPRDVDLPEVRIKAGRLPSFRAM
jgi:hypothetical protein